MKAVLLGSGNAAFHIAPALRAAGVEWLQVYSRTSAHAREMAERIGAASCTDSLDEISKEAGLYLLAVSDQALPAIAGRLRLPGKTVAHVAGSVPLSALAPVSGHHGVMYFFQTFSKEASSPDFRKIPVCLEASDDVTANLLESLARRVSDKVCFLSYEQREVLHIGGVFVNNYVNFMYTAASDLFAEQDMDFSLLHPLMEQTLEKALRIPPAKAQTGPAVRGDKEVLSRHLRRLSQTPQGKRYEETYRLLAHAIANRYEK